MTLTYATTNKFKLRSANNALVGSGLVLEPPAMNLSEVQEVQSDSQREVAEDKAMKFYALLEVPLVVMDSGLFIEDLKGFPGVYTKYALDTIGIDGMLSMLKGGGSHAAYTQRTITYYDGTTLKTFEFAVQGALISEARGDNGRDYDNHFLIPSKKKTLAELSDTEQSALVSPVWTEFAQWYISRKER